MHTVRDVAADLGVSPEEVLRRLRALGQPAASASSPVEAVVAARLRAGTGSTTTVRRPPPPPPGTAPRSQAAFGDGRAAEAAGREAAPPAYSSRASSGREPEWSDDSVSSDAARTGGARRARWLAQLAELPALVLLAFVIAVLIKTFLVQAFFIPSGSMLPALHAGDRVLVEKISYHLRDPRAQDVVVFARSAFGRPPDLPWYQDARNFMRELLGLPTGAEQDYIKRIVAVGGDTIRYAGKPRQLIVNGEEVGEPYVKGEIDRFSPTLTQESCARLNMKATRNGCLVPEGQVFVMGDNRANSEDSRVIGPIDEDKIVGHAFVVIWPVADFGVL
jgi:signal peptidase I